MAIIYEFPLKLGKNEIILPAEFEVLDVQDQRGVLTMWVMIPNIEFDKYKEVFYVVGTGVEYDHDCDYMHIGTVQQGRYVWHTFHAEHEAEGVDDEEWDEQQGNSSPPPPEPQTNSEDPFANLKRNPAANWPFSI